MTGWRLPGFTELQELGRGAQGRVVLARHAGSGNPVAIKYLTRSEGDAEAVERLRQEAVMLARISDPHVVRLHSFVAEEQGAAIVMEAVPGVSLKELLARHGAMSPEAALVVLKGSLLGLAAAHGLGVVHRDYKPANVVVQADGLSKLIDFGIAALTGVGSRGGSPAYMAPEQWRGEPATPATDVYAATCVFFECVTGARPFTADHPAALMQRHLHDPVPVQAVPEPLRPLVERGMAKEATQRPHGAAAFVAELETMAHAAYGQDWEQRGVRTLAAGAVALAAMFPIGAAMAASGTAGAGAVGAGTAGAASAAGASAGGGSAAVATTGVLAGTGAKVTMAVAGAALAIGAGTGVAVVAGGEDEPAGPVLQNVAVTTPLLAGQTRTLSGGRRFVVQNARYLQISRHTDPAVQGRINAALRAPITEAAEAAYRVVQANPEMGRPGIQCAGSTLASRVFTGLRGPKLLSVRYELTAGWVCNSDFVDTWAVTVNIALDTGRTLTPADIVAEARLNGLWARVPKPSPTEDPLVGTCRVPDRLTAADLRPPTQGQGPVNARADLSFSSAGLVITVSAVGDVGSCPLENLTLPYGRARDLLTPEVVALLPG